MDAHRSATASDARDRARRLLGHFDASLPRRCPYCHRALSARERHRILMDRLRATPTDLPSVLARAIHAAHA